MLTVKKAPNQHINPNSPDFRPTACHLRIPKGLSPPLQIKSELYCSHKDLKRITHDIRAHNINYLKTIWLSSYFPNQATIQLITLNFSPSLIHLKSLSLHLSNESGIASNALKLLFMKIGKSLSHLESFALYLSISQIREETISVLGSHAFQGMTGLKSLSLEFYCYHSITPDAVVGLGSLFRSSLKNLEKLSIVFDHLVHIRSLEAFKHLSYNVTRNLRSLKQLELKIQRSAVQKKNLEILDFRKGWRANNLEKLSLKFINCSLFDDNSSILLVSNICSSTKNLRNLELYFEPQYYSNVAEEKTFITDQGLKELICIIGENLKSLTNLSLAFIRSIWITDSGLTFLNAGLREHFVNLKSLSINCSGCKGITNNGLQLLVADIPESLPNLNQLFLSFYGCGQMTSETRKNVIEILKSIPHFKVYQ